MSSSELLDGAEGMATGPAERRLAEHSFAKADADQKTVVPVLRRVARSL